MLKKNHSYILGNVDHCSATSHSRKNKTGITYVVDNKRVNCLHCIKTMLAKTKKSPDLRREWMDIKMRVIAKRGNWNMRKTGKDTYVFKMKPQRSQIRLTNIMKPKQQI